MISILENQLKQNHPDFTFNRGQVSHEYLMVEYLMNDEEMEQSFRLKLNDAGADIFWIKKRAYVSSTSDIGASKVYASVFYDADGVRTTCNSGIALEHQGVKLRHNYMLKLQKQLGMVLRSPKNSLKNLEIWIFQMLLSQYRKSEKLQHFPEKGISEKGKRSSDPVPGGGTAIDVYLALQWYHTEIFRRK